MNHWLVKSEPFKYSWDHLVAEKEGMWDGVRNYAARNNLMAMKVGDPVLFYHSNEGKEVVGLAKVSKEHYPDPTTDEPGWVVVNLVPVEKFPGTVTLAQIKKDELLKQMDLVRLSRLSVVPVKREEFDHIVALAHDKNKRSLSGLILPLLFLGMLSTQLAAQGVKRIELPLSGNTAYQAVPLGKQGVLLISKPDKGTFNVQKFDTNLERVWSIDGPVESNLDYITYSYDGQAVFLLFSKYRSSLYQIVKVNVGPGFVETFTMNTVDRFEITDFKTLGYSVFMAGMVRNEPVLIHTQLTTQQTRVLPSAIKGSNAIQTVEVDTAQHLVNVCFAVKKGRQTKIVARSYEETGELYTQVTVDPEDDFSLLSGRLQVLNDSVRMVIGTYGYRNMQSNSMAASQGLYISKIVGNETVFTKYHSFTDFKNFFNFMSERQQEKMEKRIRKKKESGDDLKLNYRLLVHDIVPKASNFLLVAEVFYPEYRYQNPSMMGGFGYGYGGYGYPFGMGLYNPYLWNPMYGGRGYNQQVFDGFTYTHAVVADVDRNGNLLWDNSISFDNVKSMELKEKIKVQSFNNGNSKLIYSHNGAIRSKIIKGDQVIDSDRVIPNDTYVEGDKVRKTSTDDIDYWYDNFYLAWGEQRIVNAAGDPNTRGRRNVFYLNKISY